ncbi:hypothetical protein P9112_011485 [Eukaryota sp. TZLM1-RC]
MPFFSSVSKKDFAHKSGRIPSSFLERLSRPLLNTPVDRLTEATFATRNKLLETNLFSDANVTVKQSRKHRTINVSAIEKKPSRFKLSMKSSLDTKNIRPVFSSAANFGLGLGRYLSTKVDYMSPGVGGTAAASDSGIRFSMDFQNLFSMNRDIPFFMSARRLHESIEWIDAKHSSSEAEVGVELHDKLFQHTDQSFSLHLGDHAITRRTISPQSQKLGNDVQLFGRGLLFAVRHSFSAFFAPRPFFHPDKLPSTGFAVRVDHDLGLPPGDFRYLRAFATMEQSVRLLSKLWYSKWNLLKQIIPSSPCLVVSSTLGGLYFPEFLNQKGSEPFVYAPSCFLLGGTGSLRGFKHNSVGPGTRLFSTAARFILPLRKSPLVAHGFINAGSVSNSYGNLFSNMVASMGVGLAYPTSNGLFEFNMCKPQWAENEEQVVRFEFGGSLTLL